MILGMTIGHSFYILRLVLCGALVGISGTSLFMGLSAQEEAVVGSLSALITLWALRRTGILGEQTRK